MSTTVKLSAARDNLNELVDKANAGEVFVVSQDDREVAVIMGMDEYRHLKEQVEQQRDQDFDTLLLPPTAPSMAEEAGRKMAVEEVRQTRSSRAAS